MIPSHLPRTGRPATGRSNSTTNISRTRSLGNNNTASIRRVVRPTSVGSSRSQHSRKDSRQANTNPTLQKSQDSSSDQTQEHNSSEDKNTPENKTDNKETEAGSNIRVVVRCRGRNEREIKEKSHVVVKTSPLDPTSVVVGFDDVARMGQDSKIYKVDHVFGPEADQSIIYDEVVAPMISEVLAGMNCTIFAYGQTGTGKT